MQIYGNADNLYFARNLFERIILPLWHINLARRLPLLYGRYTVGKKAFIYSYNKILEIGERPQL